MAQDGQNSLLNDAQKSSLTVTLRLLEERILEFKKLQSERNLSGLLFRFENDLSADRNKRDRLEQSFDQILEVIRKAKQKFDLHEKTISLSIHFQAFTSYFWSLLMDETSEKLARYGSVAAGLKDELDPLIEQLIEQLLVIDDSQK